MGIFNFKKNISQPALTPEEAEKKLIKLNKEIESNNEKIESQTQKIENYNEQISTLKKLLDSYRNDLEAEINIQSYGLYTPTYEFAKSDLYKISGHWAHYRDKMFILGEIDDHGEAPDGEEVMALRPMTCPFQYYCYKNTQHSYRDLPIRYGETSTLFRNEDSGEMHGLTRVRQFTISEGHLIVRPDQMVEEFKGCIALAKHVMSTLGLLDDITWHLSKWDPENPEKYIGEPEVWHETEAHIRNILE